MHLLSSHIRLPSRRQARLFWQSFLITALFIGFLSGFFYVAYHGDSVQEPALGGAAQLQPPCRRREKAPVQGDRCLFIEFPWMEDGDFFW